VIKYVLFFLTPWLSSFSQSIDSSYSTGPYFHNRISIFWSNNVDNVVNISRANNHANFETEASFGIGMEYYHWRHYKGRNLGIGFEYQFNSSISGVNGHYRCFPIYIFYDIPFFESNQMGIPKLAFRLGYNSLIVSDNFIGDESESSNGIYYAIGLSNQLSKHFLLRFMYVVNQGKIKYDGNEKIFNQKKINISLFYLI
jgi:hypothetical protein